MTPTAIREGFAALRDDVSMQPLSDAATSRSEADWLVGINGTRAMTAFNSKLGGFFKTTVGRVQTPTLAILVEREAKIRKFVPRDYWEVIGTFEAAAGQYAGRWFDEKFAKPDKDGDEQLKPERVWDAALAEEIKAKCLGKPGIVAEESKPTTSMSPLLYDLTSLQRDANSRFGFSEGFGPLRHYSHDASPQRLERAGTKALRPRHETVSRNFLSSGGISGNDAYYASGR
jgi:DNA topoisomerase-3